MKHSTRYLWPVIAILAGSVAAWVTKPHSGAQSTALATGPLSPTPNTHRSAPVPVEAEGAAERIEGRVAEIINVPSYTYLRLVPEVDKGSSHDVWAAVAAAKVSVGQQVTVVGAQRMNDFNSKTLKRTFPTIYFGALAGALDRSNAAMPTDEEVVADSDIEASHPNPEAAGLPPGHPPIGVVHPSDAPEFASSVPPENGMEMAVHPAPAAGSSQVPVGKIERAPGSSGRTVSEVVQQRSKLVGTQVRVRGVVVKSMGGVLGKTFAHIRDGSGDSASSDNDLTITTQEELKVGATVMFEGTVVINKDFGAGYSYPVLLENARVVDR